MKISLTILLVIVLQQVSLCQTRLVILGTVHEPTKKFTADSVTNILNQVNPDLILLESDSSFFTNSFAFKIDSKTNGIIGMKKYILEFPTPLRPYDIEERNQYYSKTNYFERERKSYQKLRSIKNQLTREQKDAYKSLTQLSKELNKIGQKSPSEINQQVVYDKVEERQRAKYRGVNEIFEQRQELEKYRDFYKEMGDFWDKRNKAMSQNIIMYLKKDEFRNKIVVVITGFYHKYYLLNELKPRQNELNFTIKEFYELK